MTGTGPAARRADLAAAMRRLEALGLNAGSSGNASVRSGDGFLVTPSGVPPSRMTDADMVAMGHDGSWQGSAQQPPSSEWRMHGDILGRRPDISAVVHVHSVAATALACLDRDMPAFHYMVAVAGGASIRCAPYATFGTAALSEGVVAALEGRRACLMAQHGMVACGDSLDAAVALAVEVERLADIYLRALAVGPPAILGEAEMARVLEKFAAGYGYASAPQVRRRTP